MAGANVTYNGVQFDYVKTNSFSYEVVYTDDGMEVLGLRHVLNITGVISAGFNSGDKPAKTMRDDYRLALAEPRERLLYQQDAETLLDVGGPDTTSPGTPEFTRDIRGGPFPKLLSITEVVASSKTFMITWEVECFTSVCDSAGPPTVLANRWTVSHLIDKDFTSTITWTGKLVLDAGRLLKDGSPLFADGYRSRVTPLIPKGFRRESQEYTVESNGYELSYRIVDVESPVGIPKGLARWEGSYSETTDNGGASLTGEVNVKVFGKPGTSKLELFSIALQIALSRYNTSTDIPQQAAFNEQLHENQIDVRVRFIKGSSLRNSPAFPFLSSRIGTKLSNIVPADGTTSDPGLRSAMLAKLVAAKLKGELCDDAPKIALGDGETSDSPVGFAATGISVKINDGTTPTDGFPANITTEQDQFPYSFYRCEIDYDTHELLLHLPTASSEDADSHFCQVGKPITNIIITFDAQRIGKKPKIIKPEPLLKKLIGEDIDARLLYKNIKPFAPEAFGNTNTKKFVVKGKYVYGLTKTYSNTHTLRSSKRPIELNAEEGFDGNDLFDDQLLKGGD